jgi:hypothetical protein
MNVFATKHALQIAMSAPFREVTFYSWVLCLLWGPCIEGHLSLIQSCFRGQRTVLSLVFLSTPPNLIMLPIWITTLEALEADLDKTQARHLSGSSKDCRNLCP